MGIQVRQVGCYTGPHKKKTLDHFEPLSIDFINQAKARSNKVAQELESKPITQAIIKIRQYKVRGKRAIKHSNLIQTPPKRFPGHRAIRMCPIVWTLMPFRAATSPKDNYNTNNIKQNSSHMTVRKC